MKMPFIQYLHQHLLNSKNDHLSFADYMALALYHRQYGYYNSPDFAIRKKGGAFATAPEISPLFAQCFAQQCAQLFSEYHLSTQLLELGAGSGRFASDLLKTLESKEALPEKYFIYDISENLRNKQQDFLARNCPHLMSRIVWLDELPQQFSGIIIANEVLDAMPVHCFRIDEEGIKEKCVSIDDRAQQAIMNLKWTYVVSKNENLNKLVSELNQQYYFQQDYESEINLQLEALMQTLSNMLQKGVILFADYGYGQKDYYHPERVRGTLSTIYQNQRLNDPLIYPGEQDITAHVDFTRVAEYAILFGCTLLGYTTQAAFLLSCGLLALAEEQLAEKQSDENPANKLSEIDEYHLRQDIKWLTLPTEMGEVVKVMAIGKDVEITTPQSLIGFKLKDNRREL